MTQLPMASENPDHPQLKSGPRTEHQGQLYTFEDIELYTRVHYRGDAGYVIEKGEHVMPSTDDRHLKIEYTVPPNPDRPYALINEHLVNRFLRDKEYLWVDWDKHLNAYGPAQDSDS